MIWLFFLRKSMMPYAIMYEKAFIMIVQEYKWQAFLIAKPPRLKWAQNYKIAIFYNFYRFRGGTRVRSPIPLKHKVEFAKLYTYHFFSFANLHPQGRNNLRCSSRLSGIPLRSLSNVRVDGWRLSHISFTISGHNPQLHCLQVNNGWKL